MWMLGRLCTRRNLTDEQVRAIEESLEPYLVDKGTDLHAAACQNVVCGLPEYELCRDTWRRLMETRDMTAIKSLASGLFAISRCTEPLEAILPLVIGQKPVTSTELPRRLGLVRAQENDSWIWRSWAVLTRSGNANAFDTLWDCGSGPVPTLTVLCTSDATASSPSLPSHGLDVAQIVFSVKINAGWLDRCVVYIFFG